MKHKAFTLIELLVVIVIIGILATVSTATFGDYIEKARLARAIAFARQLEDGLIAYTHGWWDFDECSGSVVWGKVPDDMQVGAISGATYSTDTPYGDGCSLEFDGNDRVLFTPSSENQEMTALSFWFLNNDIPDTSQYAGQSFFSLQSSNNWGNFFFMGDTTNYCSGETLGMIFEGAERICSYEDASTIIPSQWHHVAMMFEDGEYEIYLDGKKINSNRGGGTVGSMINVQGLRTIGNRGPGAGDYYFEGKIDRLRIWYETLEFTGT